VAAVFDAPVVAGAVARAESATTFKPGDAREIPALVPGVP